MLPFMPWVLGGPGVPEILAFDDDTLASSGTTPTLSADVVPGTLFIALGHLDDGGDAAQPSACEVLGQGNATHVVSANFEQAGITVWKYEGNTTTGSQDFDFTFPDAEHYWILGVWSVEGVPTVATTGSDGNDSGALSISYTGGSNSLVLQAWFVDAGVAATIESGFSMDGNRNVSKTLGQVEGAYAHGVATLITGGTIDGPTASDDKAMVYVELTL